MPHLKFARRVFLAASIYGVLMVLFLVAYLRMGRTSEARTAS